MEREEKGTGEGEKNPHNINMNNTVKTNPLLTWHYYEMIMTSHTLNIVFWRYLKLHGLTKVLQALYCTVLHSELAIMVLYTMNIGDFCSYKRALNLKMTGLLWFGYKALSAFKEQHKNIVLICGNFQIIYLF